VMRRVVCEAVGDLGGLKVVDEDPPVPRAGQVLVDVAAAGVNFVDGLFVQGLYQIKPPTPFTPGSEVAGVVAALGEGTDADAAGVAVGDRVMVQLGLGGYAEQVVAGVASLVSLPDGLSFGQAATLVQSYATMLFAFTRRTVVEPGETVLVLGAGGGIGLAAIDVARALGLRAIAAASSADKLDRALAAGAEAGIDTRSEDVKVRARELSGGGIDLVVDPVGGPLAESALRALRVGGRYLVIGFASGEIPRLPANQVLLNNRTVVGVDWGAWTMQQPEAHDELLADLLAVVAAGRLHPVEPTAYPLDQAAQALTDLAERRVSGKVVLVP
ncbi:MAG TPA: NADPH:quinone oxidoreductase family protein, partial [Acidimicrobiales bacterium]|nr:NADPH:quinone oxidoreductase family protein [Acidimicrobiales bacterium]